MNLIHSFKSDCDLIGLLAYFFSVVLKIGMDFFSITFILAWMGVIFVELWIVLLCISMTDGNPDIQLALLFSNTGFFNKLCKFLGTRSAIDGPLLVSLEFC